MLEWDPDGFPPALLAASCVSITLAGGDTVDLSTMDWDDLWQSWSTGQTNRLWQGCVVANAGVADAPKSAAAYAVIRGSAKS